MSVTIETCRDLYLTLLKRTLLGLTIQDASNLFPEALGKPSAIAPFDPVRRVAGADWPTLAHSMIGEARMDNIRRCVEQALQDRVAGDLIETGVWRGGAVIFMRGILKAHGVTDRQVWAADSFRGLPPPDVAKYPQDKGLDAHLYRELAVSLDAVKANFERYGLLDDRVGFLEGWFRDTLPSAPIERLAVMRLDGDLYESTMDALSNLWPALRRAGSSSSTTSIFQRAVPRFTTSGSPTSLPTRSNRSIGRVSAGAAASDRLMARVASVDAGPANLFAAGVPLEGDKRGPGARLPRRISHGHAPGVSAHVWPAP